MWGCRPGIPTPLRRSTILVQSLRMVNVTITLDAETLRRVRIHARETGTSLNAIVRAYLERLVGLDASGDAGARLVDLARSSTASSGADGRTWQRADVDER